VASVAAGSVTASGAFITWRSLKISTETAVSAGAALAGSLAVTPTKQDFKNPQADARPH